MLHSIQIQKFIKNAVQHEKKFFTYKGYIYKGNKDVVIGKFIAIAEATQDMGYEPCLIDYLDKNC